MALTINALVAPVALTDPQIVTLRAYCFSVPAAATLIAAGNPDALQAWCNLRPAGNVFGWSQAVTTDALRSAIIENAALSDNLTAGRRWVMDQILGNDLFNAASQAALDSLAATLVATPTDVQALRRSVLRACRTRASNAEVGLSPSTLVFAATEAAITAILRAWAGEVSQTEARKIVFKDDGTIWTPQG